MDILWVMQIWTSLRGHFYAFKGTFLRSRYRNGIFLGWGLLKLQIYFRLLDIPDNLGEGKQ